MLEKFKGKFWTDEKEMVEEIEKNSDYDVLDVSFSYLNIIDRTGDDGEEILQEIIRAGNTIALRI